MTYTTLEQVDARMNDIREELAFYREFRSDFTIREYMEVTNDLSAELMSLHDIHLELTLDAITEDFIEEMEDLCQSQMYPEPAQEERTIEVVAETVVDALPASDDWLLEEFDAICDDPRGTRFAQPERAPQLRPQPVFVNFIQYLLFITGQVIRGLTYRYPEAIT